MKSSPLVVICFLLVLLLCSPIHLQGFTSSSVLFHAHHRRYARLEQHSQPETATVSSSEADASATNAIEEDEEREVVVEEEKERDPSLSSSDTNKQEVVDSTGRIQVHISRHATVDTESNNSSGHEIVISEYINTVTNETIIASLGSEKERLELFSMYRFGRNYSKIEGNEEDSGRIQHAFRQRTLDLSDNRTKNVLLEMWRNESLLSQSSDPLNILHSKSNFEDLLQSYATRIEMLRNESKKDHLLLDFLITQNINNMSWTHYIRNPEYNYNETLVVLKEFSEWFRSQFPYFYDACLASGCGNKANNSFTGYLYPSELERKDKAGRTELYLCGKCGGQHRFPRFNNVIKVLETRRGRCGEYSVLFLRMLRLLGYQVRWVVDWADHVWVEALYSNDTATSESTERQWIHADPCEAAVNEPLLYQSWGKNQTYILAFSDIAADNAAFALTSERLATRNDDASGMFTSPKQYHGVKCYHDGDSVSVNDRLQDTVAVVDVTATYTSDLEAAFNRRDVRGDDFTKALNNLRVKMKEIPDH